MILGRRQASLDGRIDARPHERMHRPALAHRERPADTVVIALAALVVLRAPEIRQHVLVSPADQAQRGPLVVVRAVAANVDHGVQRARVTQHPPPAADSPAARPAPARARSTSRLFGRDSRSVSADIETVLPAGRPGFTLAAAIQ